MEGGGGETLCIEPPRWKGKMTVRQDIRNLVAEWPFRYVGRGFATVCFM